MQALFDHGPPPPCPAPFNLAAYVLSRAGAAGSKPALIVISPEGAEHWSYARLEAAVLGTAAGLLAEGLRPGDRLLMRLGNSVDFPICYLGALAADTIDRHTYFCRHPSHAFFATDSGYFAEIFRQSKLGKMSQTGIGKTIRQ